MPSHETIDRIVQYAAGIEGIDLNVIRDGFEIAHIHHRLDQFIENDLAGMGLTTKQVEILETLFHHDGSPITPAYLADDVGLTRSSITSALDSLEQVGHIARRPHPSDRRMLAIVLTPSGKKIIAEHLPGRYAKMNRIVGHFASKERKFLLDIYKRLMEVFQSEAEEGVK